MSMSKVLSNQFNLRRGLLTAALVFASPLSAEQITLEGPDGSMSLTGELLEYSNGYYRIATALGEFNIDESSVRCISDACPNAGADAGLMIAGSDTVGAELMPLLVRALNESQGNVVMASAGAADNQMIFQAVADEGLGDRLGTVQIEDRGSSTGFRGLIDQTAHIAMSSRPVKRAEAESMIAAGLGDPRTTEQEFEVGIDGLMFVINPSNPVTSLTEQQITGMLTGNINNWSQVGGPDLPVTVYSRNANSGTFSTVSNRFLEVRNLTLVRNAVVVGSNEEMANAIFNDRTGFGYVGAAYKRDTKPIAIEMACGILSRPSSFAAKTGEYPLNRTLYLYTTNKNLPPEGRQLINFATSPEADGIVRKAGFTSYNLETQSMETAQDAVKQAIEQVSSPSEANLMRDLFIEMGDHHRVSTTFRFRTGSSNLDNHSERDLLRLVEFLERLPQGSKVSLVGFTDSDGSFEANQSLSVARAAAVEEQIYTVALRDDLRHLEIDLKGYGELNPVGCNGDFAGQRLNRRVEVWVQPS